MRFIDMFMTALGSLLFLALLMVFLLPRTTQTDQQPPSAPNNQKTEDRDIIKRWIGVYLLTDGCKPSEPELYVRYEGNVVNLLTNTMIGKAEPFDASNPGKRTIFVGHQYADLGKGSEEAAMIDTDLQETDSVGLKALQDRGLESKVFFGVVRAEGTFSVYAGLKDPAAQGDTNCAVHPLYLSSRGVIPGEQIVMSKHKPFAWLRRVKVNRDGSTTFGISPRTDEPFKRDLAEFSKTQSALLCQRTALCGTVDAHYAALVPEPPSSPEFTWAKNSRFLSFDYDRKNAVSPADCEELCSADQRCAAVEYIKGTRTCSLFDTVPDSKADPADASDTAIKKVAKVPINTARKKNDRFTVFNGFDMYGGDLKNILGIREDGCASACDADPLCKAYSYDRRKEACYLKRDLRALLRDPFSDTGVRATLEKMPEFSQQSTRLERWPDRRITGHSYRQIDDATSEQCEAACQQDKTCVALTVNRAKKNCSLLEFVESVSADGNAISALKTQQPP